MTPEQCTKTRRGLERLDSLLSSLVLMRASCCSRVELFTEIQRPGEHYLFVRTRQTHLAGTLPFDRSVINPEAVLRFLSHNGCTNVLRHFSPLVAFLSAALPVPICITEAHMWGVQPAQRVRIWRQDYGSFDVADMHSMFCFAYATLRGTASFYSDPTAAQYGEQLGLQSKSAYPMNWDHPEAHNNHENSIGTEYFKHLAELYELRRPAYGRTSMDVLADELLDRVINNAVYKVLLRHGSATILADMEEEAWKRVEGEIQSTVWSAMHEVLHRLEVLPYMLYSQKVEVHKAVATSCLDEGHLKFLEALGNSADSSLWRS